MVHAARRECQRTYRNPEALQRPEQDVLFLWISEADREEDAVVRQPDTDVRHAEWRLHLRRPGPDALRSVYDAPVTGRYVDARSLPHACYSEEPVRPGGWEGFVLQHL